MNVDNRISGKEEMKHKEWLRLVIVPEDTHITREVLNKEEEKSIVELVRIILTA